MSPGRKPAYRYGDNESPGLGHLKCAICDEPLRDHPIRPCGELAEKLITAPAPHHQRKLGGSRR